MHSLCEFYGMGVVVTCSVFSLGFFVSNCCFLDTDEKAMVLFPFPKVKYGNSHQQPSMLPNPVTEDSLLILTHSSRACLAKLIP